MKGRGGAEVGTKIKMQYNNLGLFILERKISVTEAEITSQEI
jgi:hypothetical protein